MNLISALYEDYKFLLKSDELSENEKNKFKDILNRTAHETDYKSSLENLSIYLKTKVFAFILY